jgi:hypothetical protein
MKKRYPTLVLAGGAALRWDSYVNIRHVYKIDWSLLKAYTKSESADTGIFRLRRESMIRMLAKGKTLTLYEPGPQFQSLSSERKTSEPRHISGEVDEVIKEISQRRQSLALIAPIHDLGTCAAPQADFQRANYDAEQRAGPPPKVPPDADRTPLMRATLSLPFDLLLGVLKPIRTASSQKPVVMSLDATVEQPLHRFWVDVKGAIAVILASI